MVLSKSLWIVLAAIGIAAVSMLVKPNKLSNETELATLQGEWKLESMTRAGVKVPPEQLFNERLIVESTQFARCQTRPTGEDVKGETGRFSIGSRDNLKTIDFHMLAGTAYGVYDIVDGKLVLCVTKEGGERPDSLSTTTSDNRVIQRFVRVEKSKENQSISWGDDWLKKIYTDLPKDATEAQKWMKDNKFESVQVGELTEALAREINPDIRFESYEQLGATSFIFGQLKSESKFAASPVIEVYCFVNSSNSIVGMQVTPTQKK